MLLFLSDLIKKFLARGSSEYHTQAYSSGYQHSSSTQSSSEYQDSTYYQESGNEHQYDSNRKKVSPERSASSESIIIEGEFHRKDD